MRRLTLILALLLLAVLPARAYAHHSLAGGEDCGTRRVDNVAEMTKGRTDGMVLSVDHQIGCAHVILRNLVGTGIDESYGYAGQRENCVRYGQQEAAGIFTYYFDIKNVDPSSIPVTCSAYSGPD